MGRPGINKVKFLKILLICLCILFVILLIRLIIKRDPVQQEKVEKNETLSEDKISALMRYAASHLIGLKDEQTGNLNNEKMVMFAKDYMAVAEEYEIISTEEYTIVDCSELEQVVKYIFNKDIDYTKVSFEIKQNQMYVPYYPAATDVVIYKFGREEYDQTNDIYTVYIDSIQNTPSNYYEMVDSTTTEYSIEYTLIFKYRIVDGRKVLVDFQKKFPDN